MLHSCVIGSPAWVINGVCRVFHACKVECSAIPAKNPAMLVCWMPLAGQIFTRVTTVMRTKASQHPEVLVSSALMNMSQQPHYSIQG